MSSVVFWIIFGLVAGIFANMLDPHPQRGGVVGAVILGILGALFGGFLSSLLFGFGIAGFNVTSIVIAVVGALVLLGIGRALDRSSF